MADGLILIVEDNDKNRKLVRDMLTFKGYEVSPQARPSDGPHPLIVAAARQGESWGQVAQTPRDSITCFSQ